jgi:hypothetical protein
VQRYQGHLACIVARQREDAAMLNQRPVGVAIPSNVRIETTDDDVTTGGSAPPDRRAFAAEDDGRDFWSNALLVLFLIALVIGSFAVGAHLSAVGPATPAP